MIDDKPNYDRVLENIAACKDVDKLMIFAENARKRNVMTVKEAASKQLKSLIPSCKKGSYEKAFWEMILLYQALLLEHGKPTLKLNKTWKMAMSEGEAEAHRDWILNGSQVWALDYFLSHVPTAITAEKLLLNNPDIFDVELQNTANNNLQMAKARLSEIK